jgi:hypothetical protein
VDPTYIAGSNMAIRVAAIRDGLRFDRDKGPSGTNYAMGEDTAFALAAQAAGYLAAHCPSSIVQHIVHPNQYEKSWLAHRAFRYGQSRGLEDALVGRNPGHAHFMHVPRWMLREYLGQRLAVIGGWLSGDTAKHMAATWEASYLAGYMTEYRRQRMRQPVT